MRRIFDIHLILFSIFILSCVAPEESSSVPTAEDQSTEQKLVAPTNDQHPCEQLDMETFTTFIGQSADAIEFRKEDLGNQICSAYLLGDNDDSSYDDLLIFQFDFMKSKDGFPNFNEAIVNILAAETFMIPAGIDKGKAVPVREVNAGDKAYIYSAQD